MSTEPKKSPFVVPTHQAQEWQQKNWQDTPVHAAPQQQIPQACKLLLVSLDWF